MRRSARWVPFALVLSCGLPTERPAPVDMSIRVPQITLDRLDEQFHLRIFPKEGRVCDRDSGQVLRDGAPAIDHGGRNVRPDERCGTAWESLRQMYGVATPVDVCFPKSGGRQSLEVPAGQYIVLVEGSGQTAAAGGGTRTITLGSGCVEVDAQAGQTVDVQVVMHEQAGTGRCGDGMVDPDELCDDGAPSENCNALCRFPERSFGSPMGVRRLRNAAVGWAAGERLVVGFDDDEDVFVHLFDSLGQPIPSPIALSRDILLDTMGMSQQRRVTLAATSAGYVAGWETLEHSPRYAEFDIEGAVIPTYDPPMARDFLLSPTSMATGSSRANPSVATNGTRVVWVFEDQGTQTVRVASTTFASPSAPAADAALLPAGMPGAAVASQPKIVALASGEFVVAWTAGTAGNRDVYAARLDANGALSGTPIVANSVTAGDQDQPALATNGTDVVIAWRDGSRADSTDTSGSAIRWRRFSAQLMPDGADRLGPTTVEGDQQRPTVALNANAVLLAWEHAPDRTIRGRFFRPDGATVVNRLSRSASDFVVHAAGAEQPQGMGPRANPSAAFGGASRFVVAWEDEGTRLIHFRTLIE
jgi:cysteine-rich repeat protein